MSIQSNNKFIFKIIFPILIGSLIISIFLQVANDKTGYYFRQNKEFIFFLKDKLVYEKHIPSYLLNNMSGHKILIYVLGGNQDSLAHRFREASILYHQGLSNKILILDRSGITDYNIDLGRNMTNNEWAISEFGKFNVKKEDIEFVTVQESFFGTLSEAKNLPDIVRKKGCNKLILVTSAYHTKRTFEAFSKFTLNGPLELYVYGSNDALGVRGVLLEYMTMLLYEKCILPIYAIPSTV